MLKKAQYPIPFPFDSSLGARNSNEPKRLFHNDDEPRKTSSNAFFKEESQRDTGQLFISKQISFDVLKRKKQAFSKCQFILNERVMEFHSLKPKQSPISNRSSSTQPFPCLSSASSSFHSIILPTLQFRHHLSFSSHPKNLIGFGDFSSANILELFKPSMGVLQCCSSRTDAEFELIYHLGSEERRKKFSIVCPNDLRAESILSAITEKIVAMPIPDLVKEEVRNQRYMLNGTPVENVQLNPKNLKKKSAMNRVHVQRPI